MKNSDVKAEVRFIKAIDLAEGDVFKFRGSKYFYEFRGMISFDEITRGLLFCKRETGVICERRVFPFTKILYYPNKKL